MLKDDKVEEMDHRASFFNNFLANDMRELERELFPVKDLHMGELNPQIGRRIYHQKLSDLRHMSKHGF